MKVIIKNFISATCVYSEHSISQKWMNGTGREVELKVIKGENSKVFGHQSEMYVYAKVYFTHLINIFIHTLVSGVADSAC